MATLRNGLVRVSRAWRALAIEQRHAAVAAAGLLVTMFLPWYGLTAFDTKLNTGHETLSAFDVFGWVEAAVLLVTIGVLTLLFQRAEERAFHLPGGDGTVIFSAGLWAAFLFMWRVFDRPGVSGKGVTIGIQWGFFFAFIASGVLAFAGYRLRVAHRAEPTAAQDPTTRVEPTPPPRAQITTTTQRRRRRAANASESHTRIAGQLSFDEAPDEPRES